MIHVGLLLDEVGGLVHHNVGLWRGPSLGRGGRGDVVLHLGRHLHRGPGDGHGRGATVVVVKAELGARLLFRGRGWQRGRGSGSAVV